MTKSNVEKKLPATGDGKQKDELIRLASESAAEEKRLSDFMDMMYDEALKKYLKNNPDKREDDFQIEIMRIPMESGGKVIDFAKFRKSKDPKIKELDLASLFTPDKTLSSLTEKERDAVNNLLKLTLGSKND